MLRGKLNREMNDRDVKILEELTHWIQDADHAVTNPKGKAKRKDRFCMLFYGQLS